MSLKETETYNRWESELGTETKNRCLRETDVISIH